MSDQFPLYPELSEAGQQEAQALVDKFKVQLKKVTEDVLGSLYCDVVTYIESDSWTNFRKDLLDGLRNYGNRKLMADYDFKKIREEIYKDFKDEIIKDMNRDNILKIEELKREIGKLREENMKLMGY